MKSRAVQFSGSSHNALPGHAIDSEKVDLARWNTYILESNKTSAMNSTINTGWGIDA